MRTCDTDCTFADALTHRVINEDRSSPRFCVELIAAGAAQCGRFVCASHSSRSGSLLAFAPLFDSEKPRDRN
jgi:hypothetical protein